MTLGAMTMYGRSSIVLIVIFVLCCALSLSVGCGDADPLAVHAPALTPEFLALLAIEDDVAFADEAVAMGEPRLTTLWVALMDHARRGDPGALAAVDLQAERVANVFAEHFDTKLRRIQLDNFRRTSTTDLKRIYDIRHELYALDIDDALPDSLKAARMEAMIAETRSLRADSTALEILSNLGRVYADLGRADDSRLCFEEALRESRKRDNAWMNCQILGTLAQIHLEAGRTDSAYAALDRAEHRARRSRLAGQTARILAFRASFTRDAGNYGAAYLLLQEARRTCREFQGGSHETRYVVAELELLERLGCWRLCAELVDEAKLVFDLPSFERRSNKQSRESRHLRFAEARVKYELDPDTGLRMFDEILDELTPRPYREHYAQAMSQYSIMLLRSGRFAEAAAAAAVGLEQAKRDHLTDHLARFELLLAEAAWATGDTATAQTHLRTYRETRPNNLFAHLEDVAAAAALDLRLTRSISGDGPELVAALERSFRDLNLAVCSSTPSVANYMAVKVFDRLRWAIHDLIEDDPALGYDFDLRWRILARRPDAGAPPTPVPTSTRASTYIAAWCRGPAAAHSPVAAPDVEHLLYLARGERMIRWRAADGRVVRDELASSKRDLAQLVMTATRALATAPDGEAANAADRMWSDLADLSVRLLPASLRASPPARLLITADDMLELLPFGVLTAGPDGDRPLAATSDIIRLRYRCDASPPPVRGHPFVLANPRISLELKRLHTGLVDLPGSAAEGRAVVDQWYRASMLSGAAATKSAVMNAVADASRIYVAAHIVRSARAPFLKFIPLAADPNASRIENSILEMRDILSLDLSSCRLVILAGCFSGTPYVTDTRLAPGFGDVFLDAGARCAVQNLWLVEDRTMARLMESVIADMGDDDGVWRLAASLRRAKTDLIAESGEDLHPFHWGGLTLVSSVPGR